MPKINPKPLVGVLPCDEESIILRSSPYFELRYLIAKGTPEQSWAQQFLPFNKVHLYSLPADRPSLEVNTFADIFKYSNIAKVIRKNKIGYVWLTIDNDSRKDLYGVAKEYHFEIIGPTKIWQDNLENKIWFDQFLAKNGLPRPASQTISSPRNKVLLQSPLVLQTALSDGGEGTFFLKSSADLKRILKLTTAKPDHYLLREYVSGKPCGITILCTSNIVALSAVREQCFIEHKEGRPVFVGIQWIPSTSIKRRADLINRVFLRLGEILQQGGFMGYANIDFIISNTGAVRIIECNPRFSSSTAQLALNPRLISNLQSGNLIIEEYLNKTVLSRQRKLPMPKSEYRGAVLHLDIDSREEFRVSRIHPVGVYQLKNKDIKFISPDIRKIKQYHEFIYFSMIALNERFIQNKAAGLIKANFPLFNSSGNINAAGKILVNHFGYDFKKS